MTVGTSLDISKLDVCFGGFTPMALSDGTATRDQVQQAEERARHRQEALDRAAEIEASRASEQRQWTDAEGTAWTYVVLDGNSVRIEGCRPAVTTLVIPSAIEDLPVVSLGADACAFLPDVQQIECPPAIVSMGLCAFRCNPRLHTVVLPEELAEFDSNWFRSCPNIHTLVYPGQADSLVPNIFDLPKLRTLVVGKGTEHVVPGTFAKSNLESLEVDERNPHIFTDGYGLYAKASSVFVALARPVPSYQVLDGCRIIGKKAFSLFTCVQDVQVPDSVEVLGDFAFSRTSIRSFTAPQALRKIGQKAFFNCEKLEKVTLGDNLQSIAQHAFTRTAIDSLRVPASIRQLGNPLAEHTQLTFSGDQASFTIADDAPYLHLDRAGGLYQREQDGNRLLLMMDSQVRTYQVEPGTVAVGEAAFLGHACLESVELPEGVTVIEQAAFKACRSLRRVTFSPTVRCIGEDAFLDTNLESLDLPASLEEIGLNALVTEGAHHGNGFPSLKSVQVEARNERFYAQEGLLLERLGNGTSRVVLCGGSQPEVRVPDEAVEIAPYAFNNQRGIGRLYLSDRITSVGVRGLAIYDRIDLIHIDLVKPVQGHTSIDLRYPDTDRGEQQQVLALSIAISVDLEGLFDHYDNAVVNRSSFDANSDKGLGIYEQAVRLVERLLDPLFLSPVNRSLADRILRGNIEEICLAVARHDDRKTMDELMDLGYLNEDNIYTVIERIGALQDASMTGYLLEAKRERFQQETLDFDL